MAVSREPRDGAETYLEGLRKGDWPHELVPPDEAVRRWPFLEAGSLRFAFHSPEGGALHCRRIATGISEWLLANGVDVREYTRVEAVDAEAGTVRLAGGEELAADTLIVTAGAWVTKLFPDLAADLRTHRTAVVYLEPPADLREAWDAAPVILDVGGSTDGYIIPCSGDGGLKFGSGLHKRFSPDADADRVALAEEGWAILKLFSPPIARVEEYAISEVVTCAYTFTHDHRFFSTRKGRCIVVSACSGHGYKFGAAVGRRIVDAVETGDTAQLQRWLRAEQP